MESDAHCMSTSASPGWLVAEPASLAPGAEGDVALATAEWPVF